MNRKGRKKKTAKGKTTIKKTGSKFIQIQKWCLGTILGLLVLAVVGNQISAVIPNPIQFIFSQFQQSHQKHESKTWFAGGVKNSLNRAVSIGTWSHSQALWLIDTLQPSETRWYLEPGPIYLIMQGDLIVQKHPFYFTHTYDGEECYELETNFFERQPNNEEIEASSLTRVTEVLGAKKTLYFLDGTKITFDIFGPTGLRPKILLPAKIEDRLVFPFQIPKGKE
jgi:hypothetical protein